MAQVAKDVMTPAPACCTPDTPLEQVAKELSPEPPETFPDAV